MLVQRSLVTLATLVVGWCCAQRAGAQQGPRPSAPRGGVRSAPDIRSQLVTEPLDPRVPGSANVRWEPLAVPQPHVIPTVPLLDVQLALTGVVTTFAPYLVRSPAGPEYASPLSRDRINPIDRVTASLHWSPAEGISDALLSSFIVLPHLANLVDTLLDRSSTRWRRFGAESLMMVEAFTLSGLVANVVKYAVRRPRPYAYAPDTTAEELGARETTLSFFSGHTSIAFSMASCYSYLFTTRHPQSRFVAPVWIGTHALAGLTGMMRVMASKHFTTDVLTGAAVGSTVGLIVPLLHDNASRWFGQDAQGLRLVPLLQRGGIGVTAMRAW
jgi:membrane-associated phospholipid phosphatase